jgi:general secretion pathway protein G
MNTNVNDNELELLTAEERPEAVDTTRATVRALMRPKGMSLLEIMVVITLIGLVAAAVSVAVMNQLEKGEMDTARNQAYEMAKSVELFKLQNGSFPTTAQGLAVLASPPKGKPIMERVPKDPWGEEYIFVIPGQKNPSKFDVRSKGPDKQEGTEDDVGNWPDE